MAQKPPVIALDLDFTLARFRSGYGGFYDIAESFGISRETAERELRENIRSSAGLSFGGYSRSLFPNDSERANGFETGLDRHFKADFSWYPGVRELLENWRRQGIPLVVVTAGSEELQTRKLGVLGFGFDEVHITDITVGKASAIRRIQSEYPWHRVLYSDDKALELYRISIAEDVDASRLELFQITYEDTPARADPPPSANTFRQISSLRELYG